jgi:hypothetical protein
MIGSTLVVRYGQQWPWWTRPAVLTVAVLVILVGPEALVPAWDDAAQRSRCLDSLLADGLVVQAADGRFSLPG